MFGPIISPGSGPIHLSDLACMGSEGSLLDCPIEPGEGQVQTCSHAQDASIECGGMRYGICQSCCNKCVEYIIGIEVRKLGRKLI